MNALSKADAQPKSVEFDGIKDPGWVEWKGGECPVPAGVNCEAHLQDGDSVRGADATLWNWLHNDTSRDRAPVEGRKITHYRIWPVSAPEPKQTPEQKRRLMRFELTKAALTGLISEPTGEYLPTVCESICKKFGFQGSGSAQSLAFAAVRLAEATLAELERTK